MMDKDYLKGRGAQFNPDNRFVKQTYTKDFMEAIDCFDAESNKTVFLPAQAKSLIHKVDSPDVGMLYSANPYQGCEHGCIYCYARNSHTYWDMSAGLDFERKIIVKENAPTLFKQYISRKNWDFSPIHLAGNTDVYQPAERRFELTKQILEIALEAKQPVSIITKNALVLRDIEVLEAMAKLQLVKVVLSINSLSEDTRQKLEPRTVTAQQRLKVIQALSLRQIPVGINVAPVIPGLTDHEIPQILKYAAEAGAVWANFIVLRLNGQVADIFKDWLSVAYPDRKQKIWHAIASCHHGQVSNSNFGERMKGSGQMAQLIADTFKLHARKNGLNTGDFIFYQRPKKNGTNSVQLSLF